MLSEAHRPRSFNDMIGQGGVVRVLKWHLDRPADTGLAFLFSGPSSSGKTTMALCAARAWDVAEHDVIRIEAATCDVAAVRQLADTMRLYGTGEHGRRAFVIDEVHTLSKRAADRLLSVLENLPAHVMLCATTTEAGNDWAEKTLLSRWTRFELSKPRSADVATLLERIAAAEGLPTSDNGWAVRYVKYGAGCGLNLRDLINQLPAHLLSAVSASEAA